MRSGGRSSTAGTSGARSSATATPGERIAEILAEVRPTIQKTLQLEPMNHELETI